MLINGKISPDANKVDRFLAPQIAGFSLKSAERRNFQFELDENRAQTRLDAKPATPTSLDARASTPTYTMKNAYGRAIDENGRTLIGAVAPEIQAFRWANGKAMTLASLRGKVVLLAFQDFTSGDKKALSDFARSFATTARVIGVQINTRGSIGFQPRIDTVSTRLAFPIAIDAPLGDSNGIGGFTLRAYGFGITSIYGYAVIERDGKVIYAGDELSRAIRFASR